MRSTVRKAIAPSTNCVVCDSLLVGKTRVRLPQLRLIECQSCGSWVYLPRPSAQGQSALHDDAAYFEHPYFQQRRHAQRASDRRCRQIFARLNTGINLEMLRGDRMLDVGCDTGEFLASAARQFGILPVGVDVSSRAVQQAKANGIEAYITDLENAADYLKAFSVITAIDLIEHVVDPRSLLQQIFSRLRPGGITYLETPNIYSSIYQVGSWLCHLTKGQPKATFERLFPDQHIQYFTGNSFATLAQECGFEIVQLSARPLPFSDLATSLPIRFGLAGLQLFDKLIRNEILICGLFRKPAA